MNLNPLYELRERLSNCAIAGVNLIAEDFRLVRAVEQAAVLSSAAPVFQKIISHAQNLLSEACEDKASTLLETLALLDAVLRTQALYQIEAEALPLPISHNSICADVPYSVLHPILEALTNTGGGRYSIILDAYRSCRQLYRDYRIKGALINGLSDSYAEISNLIEKWLIEENDPSIIPLLKKDFNPHEKKGMLHRFHVIEALAKDKENPFYLSLLEDSDKVLREAAISALRYSPENIPILLQLIASEKGTAKQAAQYALSSFHTDNAKLYWLGELKKASKGSLFLRFSRQAYISDFIGERLLEVLERVLSQKENALSNGDISQIRSYFALLPGKDSEVLRTLYRYIAKNHMQLNKLCIKDGISQISSAYHNSAAEKNFMNEFLNLFLDAVIYTKSTDLYQLVEEFYHTYGEPYIQASFAVALLTKPAKEVYQTYFPILDRAVQKKTPDQSIVAQALMDTLGRIHYDSSSDQHILSFLYYNTSEYNNDKSSFVLHMPLYEKLDTQWYSSLFSLNWKNNQEIYMVDMTYLFYRSMSFEQLFINLPDTSSDSCKELVAWYYLKQLVKHPSGYIYGKLNIYGRLKELGFSRCRFVPIFFNKKEVKKGTNHIVLTLDNVRAGLDPSFSPETIIEQFEGLIELSQKKLITIYYKNQELTEYSLINQWIENIKAQKGDWDEI